MRFKSTQSIQLSNRTNLIPNLFRCSTNLFNKRYIRQQAGYKKMLQDQIKNTNDNLKINRFKNIRSTRQFRNDKILKESMIMNFHESDNTKRSDKKSTTFNDFLKNKKIQNTYLKNRMKIFGNMLSERNKAVLQKEINEKITRQSMSAYGNNQQRDHCKIQSDRKIIENKQQTTRKRLNNTKKYTVCHMILENFLHMLIKDIQNISLKYQYKEIYNKIKQQMVQIMIENETIKTYANQLQKIDQISSTINLKKQYFQIRKIKELRKIRKPYYFLSEQKKDELEIQIQEMFEKFNNMIMTAFQEAAISY